MFSVALLTLNHFVALKGMAADAICQLCYDIGLESYVQA